MQDETIVPGAEQSGQKLQQNDQEPAEGLMHALIHMPLASMRFLP
jgi:hypothetical protein